MEAEIKKTTRSRQDDDDGAQPDSCNENIENVIVFGYCCDLVYELSVFRKHILPSGTSLRELQRGFNIFTGCFIIVFS